METRFILKRVRLVDGTNAPLRENVNVKVIGDSIDSIWVDDGNCDSNYSDCQIIDLENKYVLAPGFIDIHAHSELQTLRDPEMSCKVLQGITTEVNGNCGIGVFPNPNNSYLENLVADVLGRYVGNSNKAASASSLSSWCWRDLKEFTYQVTNAGCNINECYLTAHAALRATALDSRNVNRLATKEEIEKMCDLLQKSIDQGSFGFSSGLYYAPCIFANKEELLALLNVVARNNKLFSVHHWCEGTEAINSLKKILSIALEANVAVEVSHLKMIGEKNQAKVPELLALIEDFAEKGLNVAFDQYPYDFGSTSLFSLLPPEYLKVDRETLQMIILPDLNERKRIKELIMHPDGWDSIIELCGFENIRLLVSDTWKKFEGKSFVEIATLLYGNNKEAGCFDAFFDILQTETGVAVMADITQSQEMLKLIMKNKRMCFGTDALYSGSVNHPRSTAAAPYLLSKYVRAEHVLSIEEAIRRMTSEPARRLGILDRGLIKTGFKADILVFDYQTLSGCDGVPKGFKYVIINGKIVAKDDKIIKPHTTKCSTLRSGKIILSRRKEESQ